MKQASALLQELRDRGLKLAVAESVTGGGIAAEITAVAGASDVFIGSVTAYQNEVKSALLGVDASLLSTNGPVCAEVAEQMALGVRKSMADACGLSPELVIAVSTTGVAGPGPQNGKPAGTVFIGAALPNGATLHRELSLDGDRASVREGASAFAISWLLEQIRA